MRPPASGTLSGVPAPHLRAGQSMPSSKRWVGPMGTEPGVSAPIIGASRLSQLDEAIAALDLELDDAECARLEEPYRPHPVLGHG